jgi:hypothetical protein
LARLDRIYYAATADDIQIYGRPRAARPLGQFLLPDADRNLPVQQLLRDEMLEVWRAFQAQAGSLS